MNQRALGDITRVGVLSQCQEAVPLPGGLAAAGPWELQPAELPRATVPAMAAAPLSFRTPDSPGSHLGLGSRLQLLKECNSVEYMLWGRN